MKSFLSDDKQPVYDLRKQSNVPLSYKVEEFCQKHFHTLCILMIIFLLIIFCIVCYTIVGISAVDSGAYYYHMV